MITLVQQRCIKSTKSDIKTFIMSQNCSISNKCWILDFLFNKQSWYECIPGFHKNMKKHCFQHSFQFINLINCKLKTGREKTELASLIFCTRF